MRKIILLLLLSAMAVQGAESDLVTISGSGTISCGEAVQVIATRATSTQSKTDGFQMQNWIKGYISAYNMRGSFDNPAYPRKTSSVIPPDEPTIYLFVDTYCHKHPTAYVGHATDALLRAVGGKVYIPPGYE